VTADASLAAKPMNRSGLAPSRATLANGAVVVAKETRKTPSVTMNLAVRSGSICDPVESPGAMNLLARVIDRGSANRSAAAIAEELDGRGVTLSIGVTRHLVSLVCTCLTVDFEPILALLAEIIIAPTIPENELAVRRGEVITALAQDLDNPAVRATEALTEMLYGPGHPYGRRLRGSRASVEAITAPDLLRLHAKVFAPARLTAIVVGDVDGPRVLDTAERVFGSWEAPAPPPENLPRPIPSTTRRQVVIPMMNKAQADIAYGFIAVARSDPAFYAHWLMNNVLGQYALGGRLGDSIRERQGMAYYVSSALEAQIVEGPLLIRAGVSPENIDRAVRSIDDELWRLRRDGITEQELHESRNFLIGSMPRTLETNAGIANFLQRSEVFGLGLDFDLRVQDLLRAVTRDDVNAAAVRALDPARASIAIAGPCQGG
jgi:zinc protease